MKLRPKLTVRPDLCNAITRTLSCFMALLLIASALYPEFGLLNSCLLCLLPFLLWTSYTLLRCRGKRIFVFDWGIIFRDIRGTVTKVSYKDLSSVSFCPKRFHITAEFYADNHYVGSCDSRDENYGLFMRELSLHVPEKLNWPETF